MEEPNMEFVGQAPIEIVLDVGTHFAMYKFADAVPKVVPKEEEPADVQAGGPAQSEPKQELQDGGKGVIEQYKVDENVSRDDLIRQHGVKKGNKLWKVLKGEK
jgi:hypothetical protein